jgi:dihydrofolate synthase / folylpolyglutamate synthase
MDPLEYLFSLEKFGIKLGLENIRTLCEALDTPQAQYRAVLIGGTNGKGSVTAMVDRALRAAGVRAARYTSPHLVRLEERFVIDGQPVETSALRQAAARMQRLVEQLCGAGRVRAQPTFFEVTTAIGLDLFRLARVELAVLEVGLGGRFDATNIVEPVAAAITSVDFDHEQHLGDTIDAIAFEKAGIVRPGIPVVVGETKPDGAATIARVCRERGARFIQALEGVRAAPRVANGRTCLDLATPMRDYGSIALALRGRHQVQNAVVAVRLLEELGATIAIPAGAIVTGLSDVRWPGRLELVEAAPGRQVLLDGAHNPAGAAALARYLTETCPAGLPLVFAAMRDKDAAPMLEALRLSATTIVFTEPHNPRTRCAAELVDLARARGFPAGRLEVERDPAAALERAWTMGPLVCAAGSLFLIGELLDALGRRYQPHPV